jgi:hypothetical protein
MINNSDLDELRRMATNLYDSEKARIQRILRGIADLVSENAKLKGENTKYSIENAKLKASVK